MAHASGNRILQQSITTGTGTYALGTVLPGMLGFETEIGIGNTCWYCAASTDGYEIGIGTVGSGTLARTSILESSNSDAAVSWASGTRNLFVLHPVQKQVYVGTDGKLNIGGSAVTLTDGVFFVGDGTDVVGESGATARASLGLTIGANVQAYSANLAAIAGLSPSANTVAVFTGASTAGLTAFTQQAAELCDDTSFSAMRTTLGVGTGNAVTFASVASGAITGSSLNINGAPASPIIGAYIGTNKNFWLGDSGGITTIQVINDAADTYVPFNIQASYTNVYTDGVIALNVQDGQAESGWCSINGEVIRLGMGRTGASSSAVIDFHAQASPTAGVYDFRIVRDVSGSGLARIRQAGSGQLRIEHDQNQGIYLSQNGVQYWTVFGNLYPTTDNVASVGTGSNRMTDVFAVSGSVNTSDARAKELFGSCPGLDFITALDMSDSEWRLLEGKKVSRKLDRLDEHGDRVVVWDSVPGVRRHWGPTAQSVKGALDAIGRDAGIYVDPAVNGDTGHLGWRPHEMAGPLIRAIQEINTRLKVLEAA